MMRRDAKGYNFIGASMRFIEVCFKKQCTNDVSVSKKKWCTNDPNEIVANSSNINFEELD